MKTSHPVVSVIVPHQLDINAKYLALCLNALDHSLGVPFEVLVVAGTKDQPAVPSKFKLLHDRGRVGVAAKLEAAFNWISKESTHVLLLSDDVVVSTTAISAMYTSFQGREMIMNPMSNSDCTSMYEADIFLPSSPVSKKLTPDMQIEDFTSEELDNLKRVPATCVPKCLVPFPCVSFYCTMIPKSVWEKVGPLDPKLEFRHNDQDFCFRAMRLGIRSVVNFGAFAFHFGSRTMRHMATSETQQECTNYFMNKLSL